MSYEHFTAFERGNIEAYLEQSLGIRAIGRKLGRSASSVSREIARNGTRQGYDAERAQYRYEQRRLACRPARKLENHPLREEVKSKIRDEEMTPEQVAGRLPLEYPDTPAMRVSHETIYQAIYTHKDLQFLIPYLPQGRPKRRNRGQGKSRRGPFILNRVGIEQRPPEVEDRVEIGHWEGDTIFGRGQDGFIVTMVERVARILHATVVKTKHADLVAQTIIDQLLDRPTSWVKTITFDNGSEFAHHQQIAQILPVNIFFADPYASYQRGTNENTNGLIRRFLPKGTSFAELTQQRLDAIVQKINNRPRKCLGYRTPIEVFNQHRENHIVALGA